MRERPILFNDAKFAARVATSPDGCLLWTGATNAKGFV